MFYFFQLSDVVPAYWLRFDSWRVSFRVSFYKGTNYWLQTHMQKAKTLLPLYFQVKISAQIKALSGVYKFFFLVSVFKLLVNKI